MNNNNWHIKLFNKSVLKQNKWMQIASDVVDTSGLKCLDIGSDNGVISYLLRQNGGIWSSADLADVAVESIRSLVSTNVYQIDGGKTNFKNNEFDKIVIVDFLEHIPNDGDFLNDMYRILKPGGELIINVPHLNNSLLRRFRFAIGQTDEKHGHLRPGYSLSQIEKLLGDKFIVISHRTYSCFFSEAIDTFITLGYGLAKRNNGNTTSLEKSKGVLVTSSVREGAFVYFFVPIGLTTSEALSLSFLLLSQWICLAIIGGGWYLINGFSIKSVDDTEKDSKANLPDIMAGY